MIAVDPARTPYDVNFRLFGVPVRIHPLFWLAQVLLSFDPKPISVLVWTIAALLSLLVHEFGHVAAIRYYGQRSHVVLYAFGGVTIQDTISRRSTAAQVFISLAGPMAGFALFGLVAGVAYAMNSLHVWITGSGMPVFITEFLPGLTLSPIDRLMTDLLLCNFYWGLFNLLPIFPLDGGQVARSLLMTWRTDGQRQAFLLSTFVGALVAVIAWVRLQQQFMAIMLAWLAVQNYSAYQRLSAGFEDSP